jgi:hypothetical protein
MSNFKKPATKVEQASFKLFQAWPEAIDTILTGASPLEVMMVCAPALAQVAPGCCGEHQAAFEADVLEHLRECLARQQDAEAEMDADGDTPPPHVH